MAYETAPIGAPTFAIITASASGNTAVVAAPSNTSIKYRVLAFSFTANGTVNVKFQSNVADISGLTYCVANSGKTDNYCPVGWFETVAGDPLNINLSANIAVGGELVYCTVAT